jgi:Neurotransmitter-gated ion-channel transmembrane region
MFFASTMVMVSIALVMAVIVTNIYAKKDTPVRCPRWSVRLASRFYPAHYLPHVQAQPAVLERCATKPSRSNVPHHCLWQQCRALSQTQNQQVRDVNTAHEINDDDVICTCCFCHRDTNVTLSLSRQPSMNIIHDQFDFDRSQAEWRMVAKFTDRFFFWLFLAMSLLTHVSLFLQMVPQ